MKIILLQYTPDIFQNPMQTPINEKIPKRVFMIFIWHGAFLALTMSMLDLNTVFPALISNLTESKIIFGIYLL